VVGHRGNPAEHPENTLASFRSAIELGVDMIECDVHMSRDGHLVVIHDETVDRTTNGHGAVRDLALDQLRALDAGRGERLPLLEEVVELAKGRLGLIVETKQYPVPYEGLEEKLVQLLRAAGTVEETTVISFFHPTIKRLKELEPGLSGGILLIPDSRPQDPVAQLRAADADIYSPYFAAMDPALVEEVHAAGGVVSVWTVDDEAGVMWCKACRPDAVATNRPRVIGPALRD